MDKTTEAYIKECASLNQGIYSTFLDISSRRNWEKDIEIEFIEKDCPSMIEARNALLGISQIMEVDEEAYCFVSLVNVGRVFIHESILIIQLKTDGVQIIAIAKEGLIKQHIARKAIRQFKDCFIK